MSGSFSVAPSARDSRFEIDPSDPRFARILKLFETRDFRRSLVSLLPQGTKTHPINDGDFRWELVFECNDAAVPDGSVGAGALIRVGDFYGTLELSFNGHVWRCTTANEDAWRKEVLAVLSSDG